MTFNEGEEVKAQVPFVTVDPEGNESLVTPGAASSGGTAAAAMTEELQEIANTTGDISIEVIEAKLRDWSWRRRPHD